MLYFLTGILFALITFTKTDSSALDYTVYSFLLIAIVVQTFFALRSHNRGIPKNNYKLYRKYIISKVWYIFMNFFQMTFDDTFSCQIYADQRNTDKCLSNSLALKVFLGLIWTIVEIYFCYIIYCFYIKTLKGYFGPMGYPPIFPDIYAASQNTLIKTGIIIEANGVRLKTQMKDSSTILTGFPIQDKKSFRVSYFLLLNIYFYYLFIF